MLKKVILFLCIMVLSLTTNPVNQLFFLHHPIVADAALNPNATASLIYNTEKTVTLAIADLATGHVKIRYSGNASVAKVIIAKDNEESYPYWLSGTGGFETLPLSFGDGNYEISVWEQSAIGDYVQIFSKTISVALADDMIPFIYPNFFINYSADSATGKKAAALYASAANERKFINDVYDFVTKLSYDYEKSLLIAANNLPYRTDCDEILALGKGINLDYSTLMTAMLRSQGIPAKLEAGYIDDTYYSWVNVYVPDAKGNKGTWTIYDPTLGSKLNDTIMNELTHNSDMYLPLHVN